MTIKEVISEIQHRKDINRLAPNHATLSEIVMYLYKTDAMLGSRELLGELKKLVDAGEVQKGKTVNDVYYRIINK